MTIFNTPILSTWLHYVARFFMRLAGWHIDGRLPDIPKYVLIGAPHTSNWDFVLFLGVVFTMRVNVHFMGKVELFRSPIGWFFRYCGGIPVDRKKSTGLVEQMVKAIHESREFILTITPEGTRHQVAEWKRGFYHIAKEAGIPIVIAVVDGRHKTVYLGKVFQPTEDMESDLKTIKGFFDGVMGMRPRKKYITLES